MSAKKENSNAAGYGQQESLQAIVFADDFFDGLKPVQQVYPSILLPIVTSPLLDYLLETLVRAKVQQVYLYCSSHVEKLKAYIDSIKSLPYKDLTVTPIISDGCRSLGDALRDIDTKGFIRDDFILIRGTAFFNIDLRLAMDLHKARKEKDKKVVMTMLMRNLGSTKDSALKNECSLAVSNANTRKLLHYKKLNQSEKKVKLELEWFLEQDKVNVDTALFDTHVYLCCQAVLPLFADNFDFQTMEDFIHGVLVNEEFLDSRIYWEPLPCSAYALPLTSWETYRILCRDILQRHSYPLVPDTLPQSLKDFMYMSRRSTYKHTSAILSKGCSLEREAIIGENSTLGENSSVSRSVIGSNCTVGVNVQTSDSYIMSDAVIEDNCVIKNSIIFSSCKLKKGTKLNGCILSPGVNCKKDYSDSFIQIDADGNLVSKNIKQFMDECGGVLPSLLRNDEDSDGESSTLSSAWSSSSSLSSRNRSPLPTAIPEDDNDVFLSEVIDSLLRGFKDKIKCENLILEINSSRYAYNISIQQVSYNVVKAILCLPLSYCESQAEIRDQQSLLKTMLNFFTPIMLNYVKTESAQEDCLRAVTDVICSNVDYLLPLSKYILHYLYDCDILTEEKILEWYREVNCDADDIDGEVILKLREAVFPLIKWLQEAEEDSSDD